MTSIQRKRCFNHSQREAVALCPDCKKFFCRECVTEHEDRVLCSDCLGKNAAPVNKTKKRFAFLNNSFLFLTGFIILWFFFYLFGRAMLSLPASFHEGTIWQTPWWQ